MTLKDKRDELEKKTIKDALIKHSFIVNRVAKELGVPRSTVYKLMKKHEISKYTCDLCRDQCWTHYSKYEAPKMCKCHPLNNLDIINGLPKGEINGK